MKCKLGLMKPSFITNLRSKRAALRYNNPSRSVRLVLVGGDFGATTTAKYIASILEENGETIGVFTNRGSRINDQLYPDSYDESAESVQKAIAKSRKVAKTVVMEATDKLVKTGVLDGFQCDMVVITAPGNQASELLEVSAGYVVTPADMQIDDVKTSAHQMISFGEGELAEAHINDVKQLRGGTEIDLVIDHQTSVNLATYLLGKANAFNVAAAVAACYLLGFKIDTFAEGVAGLDKVQGNFEELNLNQNYRVYVDAAICDTSIDIVSASAKLLAKRRLLVAADETISNQALEKLSKTADQVTVVKGEEISGRYHAESGKQALELTFRAARKDDLVLIIGSQYAADLEGKTIGETMAREILES